MEWRQWMSLPYSEKKRRKWMDDPWGKQLSRSFDLSSQPLPSLTFTSLLSHLRLQSLGTQVWRQRVSAQPIVCLCCLMAAVIDSEEQSEPPANWSVAAAALFQVSPHIFSQFTSNKQSNALLLAVQIWGGGWPCIIWRMSEKYSGRFYNVLSAFHFGEVHEYGVFVDLKLISASSI